MNIPLIKYVKPNWKLVDLGIHAADWKLPYDDIIRDINFELRIHEDVGLELLKNIAEQDFFFFFYLVLKKHYINHPFTFVVFFFFEKIF